MSQMVGYQQEDDPIYITNMKIQRTRQHQVVTKMESKIYKPCCEKRKFNYFDSEPYGYKKAR